ncbi:MAG: hypothetical protein PHO48_03600 [Candidatus Gracilibacteria bacterium]|nr:hypothetical protein [Candidatus Gracilibacteria bacterium]MDD5178883.1 hypothetical protein [Candidatus Gracilibacteria bacterium]
MQKTKSLRALVLFSGGLDSILAVKILQRNGFEVIALTYETPFFSAEKGKKAAADLGIRSIVKDISEVHFEIVKHPPHGYGKNMNPCIDCHALMLRIAGEIASQESCVVIATGEVLGQRPFSQTKNSLNLVEKVAGLSGKVLRPLSAKLLPATEYETAGVIQREGFLDISGRGRFRQIELAAEFGITDFPSPAGGCKLTQIGYSDRLRELISRDASVTPRDAELLSCGRFFSLGEKSFMLLGRDSTENEKLEGFATPENYLVRMEKLAGPVALIQLKKSDDFENLFLQIAEKIRSYGRESKDVSGKIAYKIWGILEEIREA